jgi:hypothetical protein
VLMRLSPYPTQLKKSFALRFCSETFSNTIELSASRVIPVSLPHVLAGCEHGPGAAEQALVEHDYVVPAVKKSVTTS